ncbi:protein spinster homolog 3-like [Guaruba guarouba]
MMGVCSCLNPALLSTVFPLPSSFNTSGWSFVWSSLALAAVAFVTGALGMWVPLFLYRAQLVQGTVSPCLRETCNSSNRDTEAKWPFVPPMAKRQRL